MPSCNVCVHPARASIDAALVQGFPAYRALAARHGVSRAGLTRHLPHLPARAVKAQHAREVVSGDALLEQIQSLAEDTIAILEAAKSAGPGGWFAALGAIKRRESQIELFAKLVGELGPDTNVNVSFVSAPAWRELERVITEALEPYPEARQAVAAAIMNVAHHAAG